MNISFSKLLTSLILLAILFITNNFAYCSINNLTNSWFSILLGFNPSNFKTENTGNGSGFSIGFIYSHPKLLNELITFRIMRSFEVGVPLADTYKPHESFNEVSILYGKVINYKNINLSGSIGLGFIAGINRGKWTGTIGQESYGCERLPYYSIGTPVAFQINTNSSESPRLGLQLFGNFNLKQSILGFALIIKLG